MDQMNSSNWCKFIPWLLIITVFLANSAELWGRTKPALAQENGAGSTIVFSQDSIVTGTGICAAAGSLLLTGVTQSCYFERRRSEKSLKTPLARRASRDFSLRSKPVLSLSNG
jgi:hypothetical protein